MDSLLNPTLLIALVFAVGIACQWVAWRIRIPAILPLLFTGLLAGPVGFDIIRPQEQLGNLFFPVVSLSVSVILFEGALTLTWRDVRAVVSPVRRLLTIGAAITWLGGAVAAHYLLDIEWRFALLFGALISVTGPTVIAPLLRNVRPTPSVASVLRWEGILIDPIGATLAVLIFEFIVAGEGASFGHTLTNFLRIAVVGSLLGLAGGALVYSMLRRFWTPDYLRDVVVLALVLLIFAISGSLAEESGLLAVTVMGVFLANTNLRQLHEIWYFKEKLSVVLVSVLFILLAANITPGRLQLLDSRALMVLLIVMLVLRPLSIAVASFGSSLTRNERLFLSWIAPRGIVAAAVSSLFSFNLVELGYTDAAILGPLTFLVIVATVLIQGGTAKPVARVLGVAEADPQGLLIMGSHPFSRRLAETLVAQGIAVRLVDSNWDRVREARMQSLEAQHANVLSMESDTDFDLTGIGRLLAMTSNDEANALACKHLEEEFGSAHVYQLPPRSQAANNGEHTPLQLGRLLFDRSATFDLLTARIEAGDTIVATKLTDQFSYADLKQREGDGLIPLLACQRNRLTVATVEQDFSPSPGWTVIALRRRSSAVQPPAASAHSAEKPLMQEKELTDGHAARRSNE